MERLHRRLYKEEREGGTDRRRGIFTRRLLCRGHGLPSFQGLIKEIGGGAIGADPGSPQEEAVDLVRENQLFKRDLVLAQAPCQVRGLGEGDVAMNVQLSA